MQASEQNNIIIGALIIICSVCVTIALIYTSTFLIPFVLALFLTYLLSPMIEILQHKARFPRFLAILTTLTFVGMLFSVIIPFIVQSISTFIFSIDQYKQRTIMFIQYLSELPEFFNVTVNEKFFVDAVKNLPLLEITTSFLGNAASIASNTILVLIFLFFMLSGSRSENEKQGIWLEIDSKITRYLMTKLVTSFSTGMIVGFVLWVLGVELAVVFGVLAFFLNFIPNVGSIVATLLPMPIAFLQFSNPLLIAAVFFVPATVQLIIGSIIEPTVMGSGFDLHPVTILCALIFWGLIWGVTGMLLAAPMTAILKVVFQRFSITRPVAEILAGRFPSFMQQES